MSSPTALPRRGFTLAEMLIAIAVLCVLLAILLPLLRVSHEGRDRSHCLNNVKNLALACVIYELANSTYPTVIGSENESFLVQILPILEQKPLFDDFRNSRNTTTEIDNLAKVQLEVLCCLSTASSNFQANKRGSFTSHYVGCSGFTEPILVTSPEPSVYTQGPGDLGLDGLFSPKLNLDGTLNIGTNKGVDTNDVHDGLSNTMSIIETSRGNLTKGNRTFTNTRVRWSWGSEPSNRARVNWGRSVNHRINSFDEVNGKANPLHQICISSEHSGGANVAKGDGSVYFVSEDIDLDVLKAAAGIDDGVELDFYD